MLTSYDAVLVESHIYVHLEGRTLIDKSLNRSPVPAINDDSSIPS